MSAPTALGRLRASVGLVLVAWLISRLLLVAWATGSLPYPDGSLVINDVKLYAEWSDLLVTGRFPVGDDMWQYPPAAGIVFALAGILGPNPVAAFLGIALLADLAILLLLVVAGRRRGVGLDAAWAWVIAGLLVGPVFVARFDVLPTLFAVAGLVLLSRPLLAGASLSVGTLLKLWPVLLLIAIPRRALPPAIAGFAVATVLVLGAVLLWSDGAVAFLGEQGSRGLQIESVGAWPFMVVNALPVEVPTEFRYGSMEVDLPVTVPLGLVITVAGFAVIGAFAVLRLLGRLEGVAPCDVALATLLVSLVTSRVLSPQYSVWVAGIAAVTFLDPASRTRRAVWLLVPSVLVTQVIYPFGYGSFTEGSWWGVALQSIRVLLLLAATVIAVSVVVRGARRPATVSASPPPQPSAAAESGA